MTCKSALLLIGILSAPHFASAAGETCIQQALGVREYFRECYQRVYGNPKLGPTREDVIAFNRRENGGDLNQNGHGVVFFESGGKIYLVHAEKQEAVSITLQLPVTNLPRKSVILKTNFAGHGVALLARLTPKDSVRNVVSLTKHQLDQFKKTGRVAVENKSVSELRQGSRIDDVPVEITRGDFVTNVLTASDVRSFTDSALVGVAQDIKEYSVASGLGKKPVNRPTCKDTLKRERPAVDRCLEDSKTAEIVKATLRSSALE